MVNHRRIRLVLLAFIWLSVAIVPSHAGQSTLVFTDIAPSIGANLPGTLTESIAWGDYDDDGDEDLYLTNVSVANSLFRNDGTGVFTEVGAAVGVDHPGFSVGSAFADLDNDGDLELYVVTFSGGPDVLYRNDGPIGVGGETVYTDVTASAGVTDQTSSRGVSFIDFDRDGMLDIYVNAIGADILYRNQGDLLFDNVASAAGIVGVAGQGVGVVATDIDDDGWGDLFTGNRTDEPNRLFRNDLASFVDITAAAGIDKVGLGMGVLSFDYDNDLDFDLYWTTWPGTGKSPVGNAMYENLDGGDFAEVAVSSGTTDPLGWGISCNAGDIDNDGWEDFYVTNGFDPTSSANVLFHNNGAMTFVRHDGSPRRRSLRRKGGCPSPMSMGTGDLDVGVTADLPYGNQLWLNESVLRNHWLTLHLTGRCSNWSAVGARIEVTTDVRTTVKGG